MLFLLMENQDIKYKSIWKIDGYCYTKVSGRYQIREKFFIYEI